MIKNAATADLTELIQKFDTAGRRVENAAEVMLSSYAYKVQDAAKRKAPVKTGKLRDSIAVTKSGDAEYTIGPKVPYGLFQEFGTGTRGEFKGRPYTIRPKSGSGRLNFKTKDGRWVSAREITHPGIKPHSFMRPGLEEVLGPLAEELARKGALSITRGDSVIERRPLTKAIVELLQINSILAEVGVVPDGGGWINGQPNANGSNFQPYSTVLPMAATRSEGAIGYNSSGFGGPQSEWQISYGLNSYGVSPEQAEWMADRSRATIIQLKNEQILMTQPCVVVWVNIDVVGGLNRNDATDPPYWGQQDSITFWLSEVA